VSGHQLAQVNISRLLAPIDAPETVDFVAALDPVNKRADSAPGFVWRLQTEEGNATSVRAFDDPLVIVNLSVWESIEALEAFAYRDEGHRAVLRRRREWFERHVESHTTLWWIPAGTMPTVAEATSRLAELRANGPTQRAFTFKDRFSSP
jgi:Domain of unknown function (DUF3291)